MTSRKRAIRAAERRIAEAVPAYQLALRPVRGRCLRRRCKGRWAVPRATVDTRDAARIERVTILECATCGHPWRRTRDVPVQVRGFQTALVTLIVPPASADAARTFRAHGAVHAVGEDARIVRNAGLGDADEAVREWRHRADLRDATRARAAARKAEAEAAAVAAFRATLAAMDARREAEAEAEAAAAAREAAY